MDNIDKDTLALAITKALAFTENGGKPNIDNLQAGKTGETKSIFQFTPDTWKNYAGQVLGDSKAPLTNENESLVVHKKVSDWIDKGYTPEQIASMWNAGQGEPDAYGGKFSNGAPSVGINKKYGVKFDVPGYAKKVKNYTEQFIKEQKKGNTISQSNQNASTNIVQNSTPTEQSIKTIKPESAYAQKASLTPTTGGLIQHLLNNKIS